MNLEVEWNSSGISTPSPSTNKPLVCVRRSVDIPARDILLHAECVTPPCPRGLVLFADADPTVQARSRALAEMLRHDQLATGVFTLRGPGEMLREERATETVSLLADRLVEATRWVARQREFANLGLGYIASGWGAAAALRAVTLLPPVVDAVVCRAGRVDLAAEFLPAVETAVAVIVGGTDDALMASNRDAFYQLHCDKEFAVVANAGHYLDEPLALQRVGSIAAQWFISHLRAR